MFIGFGEFCWSFSVAFRLVTVAGAAGMMITRPGAALDGHQEN